jgi:membrane fusion protein (multidrug efflux system)
VNPGKVAENAPPAETAETPDGPGAPRKHDEIGFALPEPAKVTRGTAIGLSIAVTVALSALFLVAFLPRTRSNARLAESTKAIHAALPRVEVIVPKVSSSVRSIVLPGTTKPLEETVLYSRANGFVRAWNVDIGDKVKEGQPLVQLETPELDQEILQARAQLAQAEAGIKQATANADLSRSSLDRYKKLAAEGLATQQQLDEKSAQAAVDVANVDVAQAMIGTQRANLARQGKLKSFASVTAPFAGTITARMVERGALVVAGNSSPLFKLSATDPVRIYVDVPQDVAPSVKPELLAEVTVREYPGRVFRGKITRTSGALDSATRTLSTEIRVPNPDNALLTGMYTEVSLSLPVPHKTVEVPATSVTTGENGVRVQVVEADGTVRLVPVVIERDLGASVQISSGLTGSERVVKLASAELVDGSRVQVAH